MAGSLPKWITYWFAISTAVVLYDAAFCLLRPRSMRGGDLFFVFSPYDLYGEVDKNYGWKSYDERDGLCGSQAFMNLIEASLQVLSILRSNAGSPTAALTALIVSVMTLAKTSLYLLCEPFSGFKYMGHNSLTDQNFWFLFAIPTSFWLIFPTASILWTYPRVAKELSSNTAVKQD